jgi:hypothetical protein
MLNSSRNYSTSRYQDALQYSGSVFNEKETSQTLYLTKKKATEGERRVGQIR